MLKLEAIDHLVLRARDLPRMLAFYCDVLGCEVEREVPELGLTQLRAGNALIDLVGVDGELGKLGGSAPGPEGRNLDHFCLRIVAVAEEDLTSCLQSRGVNVSGCSKRYGAQGYGKSIYIEDPEGNTVELKLAILP
ncbi:MAG TPA: VOC family virulence protein [Gammaproteobacteria bacterium]|nr:VOC family virulence protein [Gammaproteobacteria bacterium]